MRLSMFLAALALSAASVAAHADPITYTLSGNISGSLGTLSFTDAASTFTFSGDSANIASLGAGYYTNTSGVGTVTISGVGTATFLSPGFGVLSEYAGAGFADLDTGFDLGIYDPSLVGYALTAPFIDSAYFVDGFSGSTGPESTSLGDLNVTGGDYQTPTTTFTASSAVTPEPSSLALLGTGLLGMAAVVRRRYQAAA